MELFGGKWNSRIICVLATLGTLRYSELRREMGNITDAVLASTLKELIANGIVERKSYNEIPPRVEYSLTEKGMSVVPIVYRAYPGGGKAGAGRCRRDHSGNSGYFRFCGTGQHGRCTQSVYLSRQGRK